MKCVGNKCPEFKKIDSNIYSCFGVEDSSYKIEKGDICDLLKDLLKYEEEVEWRKDLLENIIKPNQED